MLSIFAKPGRLCDGPSRRELLTAGGCSLLGLSLPAYFARRARAEPMSNGFGRAKSVILMHLQGSPSHIDLWDPKPAAPAEIRGEFKPIPTTVPGLQLGEVLPMLARQAHRFALVRSLGVKPKGLTNHGAAIYMLLTAADPTNFTATGLSVQPTREDLPSVGSNVARYRAARPGALSYAAICGPVREGAQAGVAQGAGLLGPTFDPLTMYEDPTAPLKLDALNLPPDVTLGRLQGRLDLRGSLGAAGVAKDFDAHYGRALSLLSAERTLRAFRLEREPEPVRERYGRSKFGQSLLLARRLVEAETRFVQVTWPAGSDTEPVAGPDGSWDTHRNNFPMLRDWRCPVFDRALSALIEDLAARGLLDSTLILAVGEFGRSPKIGAPTTDNVGPGGRDHWPSCYTALIAGGGIRGGQVYGESDKIGAYPQKNPVHPYELIATVYHALGIDAGTIYHDTLNRPRRLVEHGGPVLGLFA